MKITISYLMITMFVNHKLVSINCEETSVALMDTELNPFEPAGCLSHTYIDSPPITYNYNYAICTNVTVQPGKQLAIDGSPDHLKYILFNNSNLTVIPPGVFNTFSELSQLYLNNTKVNSIAPGAFNGLGQLKELYLQENNLTEISRGTLNFLLTLRILDFSKNSISRTESGSLLGLLHLKVLNLSNNNLNYLNGDILVSTNSLETLDISHNRISKFNEMAVLHTEMRHLKTLLINNNKFKDLPMMLLGNLSHLEFLDASFNNLTKIDFGLFISPEYANYSNNQIISVHGWSSLKGSTIDFRKNKINTINAADGDVKYLHLGWNELQTIDPFTFKKCENLTQLHLSNNVINKIHVNSFYGLENLLQLHLNDNKISSLPVGCFSTLAMLKVLSLSHNSLKDITYGTFSGLVSLTVLNLGYNKLIVIHEQSFHVLSSLDELYLNQNMLTSLNAPLLLTYVPYLKIIDLNGNEWNCNELLNAVQEFRNRSISVITENSLQTSNIFGIACNNLKFNTPTNYEQLLEPTKHFEVFLIVIALILGILLIVVIVGILSFLCFRTQHTIQARQIKLERVHTNDIKSDKLEDGSIENVYCNLE